MAQPFLSGFQVSSKYMNPCRTLLSAVFLALPASVLSQSGGTVSLPAGTPLPIKIVQRHAVKVGEPLRGELLYAVYDHDKLVLPVGTVVTGSIVSLTPDHARRVRARLRADFTPFHNPVVRFDGIVLPDGSTARLTTGEATNGAPVYRLVPPPPQQGGFIARQFATVKQVATDRIEVFTGPDKGDRLKQFLYSQLPYHPESIAKDTAWTVETAQPLPLPGLSAAPIAPAPAATGDTPVKTWMLQAYLADPMSSATSKAGQAIHAVVAEPILNPDGTVAVPQGSVLSGAVTQARPARMLGRAGELRFSFRELTFPGAQPQPVQVALAGADNGAEMAMNSEGEVKPKPKDKIVVPLILIFLAARPLDTDGGHQHHMFGKDAVASNGLGTIGFIVGTAARQPYFATALGAYSAAVSVYERIFSRGAEVTFGRDTRIVLQTTARRTAAMRAAATDTPAPQP